MHERVVAGFGNGTDGRADSRRATRGSVQIGEDGIGCGCDTCNNTHPPSWNKANVEFQFPKDSLAKASAGDVEDTIRQLLTISDDSQPQAGQQPGRQQGWWTGSGWTTAAGAGRAQITQMGMSTDQVQASLGQPPSKVVNLGRSRFTFIKI